MLNDRKLDVEALISKLRSDGVRHRPALAAARPRRVGSGEDGQASMHPESKILFGGYSSTYYHEELIRYPQVDLVLRGDSTEVPVAS